jgi:hypothetical protein
VKSLHIAAVSTYQVADARDNPSMVEALAAACQACANAVKLRHEKRPEVTSMTPRYWSVQADIPARVGRSVSVDSVLLHNYKYEKHQCLNLDEKIIHEV